MTFAYPLLPGAIKTEENRINVLIIENPAELCRLIRGLQDQIKGDVGECVLGDENIPLDFSAAVDLVTDPFRLAVDQRKLATKLLQEALLICDAQGDRMAEIISAVNNLAAEICAAMSFETDFTVIEDTTVLLKVMDLHISFDEAGLAESLLSYMKVQRKYFGKRFFILYGLQSLLTVDELHSFYRSVFYDKLDVMLLEPHQKETRMEEELITIIDGDLCIIS
ncbi:MAG: type II-A CRISPR-associated protein Csn2 [Clostridia bacterium]|nr:type II-A CRISPR-associated protein Csn2 [Clostridia bacterium]